MTLQNKEIHKQKYLVCKLCVKGTKKELQNYVTLLLAPPAGLEPATL